MGILDELFLPFREAFDKIKYNIGGKFVCPECFDLVGELEHISASWTKRGFYKCLKCGWKGTNPCFWSNQMLDDWKEEKKAKT
jgi:predicted RNA-binding Zn-ribbon protein involved in translation (DUF1610 family)